MAQATVIKGGKVYVFIGDNSDPTVYSKPCGFTSRSVTLSKNLEEVNIPDCDDPDKVDWVGRSATSLSMEIKGEGVLAVESFDIWLKTWENHGSSLVKIEFHLPNSIISWKGKMQASNLEIGASNGQTVTLNVSLSSDGEMVRTSDAVTTE